MMSCLSDVLIIGCGISGLSVAYHLLLNNFNGRITILESCETIGGRISSTTTRFDKHRIELGANWIHGIIGNPIYELAVKHQLIDQLNNANAGKHVVEVRDCVGNNIDVSVVEEVCRSYFYFIKKCENYFQLKDTEDHSFVHKNSVGAHLRADIDNWISNLKADNNYKDLNRSIFETLMNRETCISGCHSLDQISLKDFGSYTELAGGNITIPNGYVQVINSLLNDINAKLAEKIKLGDKSNLNDEKRFTILKSHEVIQIKWKNVENIPFGDENQTNAEVYCNNGSVFKCNHVVVTLPLGVLKRDAMKLFDPILPQYKLDSINALSFGVVNKIFLEYSLPLNDFIDENTNEIILLWNNVSEKKWFHKIYSFSKVTDHCLLAWVSGEEAIYLEKLSDQQINEDLTQLLKQFLVNDNFPKADHIIATHWSTNQYSCGSYTYIPFNASIRDIELLSQPIYTDPSHDKPILVFGGEATHPSFYSTVHGAFLSGRKAAYYLLDADPPQAQDSNSNNDNITKSDKNKDVMTWSCGLQISSNL